VKRKHRITLGILVFAAFACADRDAELREEFRAASLALADQRIPGSKVAVEGRDGWILHSGEVQYLKAGSYIGESASRANRYAPPEYADPLPVIVDFHRQLQERGIELFFVPVPVRSTIYPESVLGSEPFAQLESIPNLHLSLQELLYALQEKGVRVFDVTPTFLSQRELQEHGPLYCPSDTHWTPSGIAVASKMLAAEIEEKPWFKAVPKQRYRQTWTTEMHNGDLYQEYEKAYGTVLEPDPVQMRRIMRDTKKGLKNFGFHQPQSPVIVIGDSNSTRWSNFRSGLPHSLAFDLGFPVDVLSAAGGGANETRLNLVRKIRAEPEYLEGKRVVIWCFSARAFTNTRKGWIQIPL
jgi:alginate O-acetyltransferase complex protein AlgJ